MLDSKKRGSYDLLIRHATIVDGTGRAAYESDVATRDDRIVAIGSLEGTATREIDGRGLLLCPGFVDPHTHYDAQLFWDPLATPSSLHGVTTLVGGNCGFTLAPVAPNDEDYLCRMMSNVEGMSFEAIRESLPWDWHSFGDYLARLEGRIAVNAGFLVGHCAIRRAVMGEDAIGHEATPAQLREMVEMLRRSLDSGGLGFSTSRAFTHKDGAGDPVASRWATEDEVLALCREVGAHEGTTLEFIFDGCLNGFSDEEVELASAMSLAANRPANWNVLTISAAGESGVRRQIAACEAAAAKGARIVALTMPVLVDLCMSFGSHCALHSLPGWGDVLSGPLEDRLARLRDPEIRAQLQRGAQSPEAGVLRGVTNWASYRIGDTTAPELAPLRERTIADVAAERGGEPFDTLLDIVIADELRTILWPAPRGNDDESWKLRREAWESPHVMLGGSDAGAHLDRMCGSPYPTMFLADVLRGRRLVSIERAVEMLTSEPAALFGLRGRGRIEVGSQADLVLLDPSRVDATPTRAVEDLPDGSLRLVSDPIGINQVIVNGQIVVEGGEATGAVAGRLLRSGRDTDTVTLDPAS
ncbi:MAG: amidohydrolase family protein [Deltaproteobacteria bacterium]|jgi:N-acyl-D-aspartate/D-glutamate deacylase|nr:amidohydrolase family protein [Deltaproteobacteria bacterium]